MSRMLEFISLVNCGGVEIKIWFCRLRLVIESKVPISSPRTASSPQYDFVPGNVYANRNLKRDY